MCAVPCHTDIAEVQRFGNSERSMKGGLFANGISESPKSLRAAPGRARSSARPPQSSGTQPHLGRRRDRDLVTLPMRQPRLLEVTGLSTPFRASEKQRRLKLLPWCRELNSTAYLPLSQRAHASSSRFFHLYRSSFHTPRIEPRHGDKSVHGGVLR